MAGTPAPPEHPPHRAHLPETGAGRARPAPPAIFPGSQRTANLLSIKNLFSRNTGIQVPANEIKRLTPEQITEKFEDANIALAITSSLAVAGCMKDEIARIETTVLKQGKLRPEYKLLESIPGIGVTLALTIMYETGSIDRFADAGHFCSYCRCVPSQHLSNGKVKGSGNVRNGNPYLSWAFTEAAHFAIRFDPIAKRFYERNGPGPTSSLRYGRSRTSSLVRRSISCAIRCRSGLRKHSVDSGGGQGAFI